ncbi:MAG: VOC family protein [Solirubrobacteraceae bacterium]
MITGDAPRIVDFYGELLGLRLVKATVNFDRPEAYHLYFGDETGAPGSILTWFEFAGAPPGRAGDTMIHTVQLGVGSSAALGFWTTRWVPPAATRGAPTRRCVFVTPTGWPASWWSPHRPTRHSPPGTRTSRCSTRSPACRALAPTACAPCRATRSSPTRSGSRASVGGEFRLLGEHRQLVWAYDDPPAEPGHWGAGTVHHIAWAAQDEDHLAWRARVAQTGAPVTDVRDRDYFKSIYFREPHGVLFEVATLSPGFAVDEPPDHLGEQLTLPRQHEHLRAHLARTLTPITNPRTHRRHAIEA